MFALLVVSSFAFAEESTTSTQEIPSAVTKALKSTFGENVKTTTITPAPITGLFEVVIGSELLYITADGKHFVAGNIFELRPTSTDKDKYEPFNLTDQRRTGLRTQELNQLDESEMVVFAPETETKHTINVFTDVDCPYCAKFHLEVAALNKAGVKVRYLAFPRAGVGSKTYQTMMSIWCAEDRKQAMTDAKARKKIEERQCTNPITKQYELGKRIGITGTPAMVLSDGQLVPGYLPAARLLALLNKK
ncbi:thiol:disulfide interchange protein DsbC [Beggiatoa sp. PS]|nr:thiol:disulfide interchange protein DsbC [Beggiatoa sp. PS]